MNEVTADCVHSSSDSHQMLKPIFVLKMGSSHWVAILLLTRIPLERRTARNADERRPTTRPNRRKP